MSLKHERAKYKDISFETRVACSVCASTSTVSILELPNLPLTEIFISQPGSPTLGETDQALHYCRHCGHAQLQNILDQSLLYSNKSGYEFRTSQSYTGRKTTEFFLNFFSSLKFKDHFECALEIGCNDGFLLKKLKPFANSLIGIDPILKDNEQHINDEKITVFGDFFENCDIVEKPDLIICKDVIEHVTDPKSLLAELINKASDNALFMIQVPILDKIIENYNFDHIFHQHLNYFSVSSFAFLLESLGCSLIDYTVNEDHWNSAIFAFTNKKNSNTLKVKKISLNEIEQSLLVFKSQFNACELALEAAASRLPVYGYGAALMLPVIKYHFPNKLASISKIFDDNPSRDGQFYLNSTTPIVATNQVIDITNSAVMLTAFSSRLNAKRMLNRLSTELNPIHIYYPFNLLNGAI